MTRNFRMRRTATMIAIAAAFVMAFAGCQSTPEEEPPPEPPSEFDDASEPEPEAAVPVAEPVVVDVDIATVYFDFDKSDIRSDAVDGLRVGAEALKASGAKVVIAGHTDNRGSEEYNLALGERRAASVRRYLTNLGVDMNQMTIVSYGEVRPAVQGNNETAWARNRRAEFKSIE
jgi:peptidoglycan-associated lipoprotein